MITQFGHLTLSTPHFEEHRALLKRMGFTERFVEHDSKNPQIKGPFMHQFKVLHDLALFDAPNSLSIELVKQGSRTSVESSMTPIFENVPPALVVESTPALRLLDGVEVSEARITGLEVPIFMRVSPGAGSCTFKACVIRVPELKSGLEMWKALGCTIMQCDPTQAVLSFTSPFLTFPAKFYLIEMPVESRLDSYGFNYVAFVATSASEERERFLTKDLSATSLAMKTVNGRSLELFFLYEGGRAPIEILGFR